ncbi:MAG: methionine adenosyltransferase [Liquorilactobacillus nagelii]|jgi:S-adenosylmethionine synthetase|uniref:S-adenosylmethionine synthase n=2 Tax=Liquorilactobacillus nagelii TaxID=82688 RepID=A0A3S6QY64_9LACO|nr:methionine adenosyltransferase [Liquorilactobacillus nagelii]AUJ32719.1 methionine adenosyltransferase [Liquorilactobacillus nagelii]MCC7616936.1 methionine adenosyltransferase [Liquorilactobacillus nagelii]MCP9315641.1 methionine adenosyltransferase [Liquorilactobacillus nagelii]
MKKIAAESVTEGHPDKVCDQLSDSLLDAYLEKDSNAKVALECMISKNLLLVSGEVSSRDTINYEKVIREKLLKIGYDNVNKGFDARKCIIEVNVRKQSPDISIGVKKDNGQIGAGDQGTVYGYATSETPNFIPMPIYLANKLAKVIDDYRHRNELPYLRPDGKTQVVILYDKNNVPIGIDSITLSVQHDPLVSEDRLREDLFNMVIKRNIAHSLLKNTKILINPTGRFVIGGPEADTGVTGRKLFVDTYGCGFPHGGGAFSGKDPTKVDRSAAYMARFVAKNIVASKLAAKCLISLTYVIGLEKPVNISLNTFGTEKISLELLREFICRIFDFSPREIISVLHLKQPIYSSTAVYGHFKDGYNYPWESTKIAELLRMLIKVDRI